MQPTTVAAAGLASTSAAAVTSSIGVAGTILGAAITTMIITGGSALIKVGMERTTGTLRKTTRRVRDRNVAGDEEQPPPTPASPRASEGDHPPERPDLRNNLMGRLRAGISKFARLPERRRRSVIVGTAIASLVAFIVAMATVTGVELAVGKTLSCWVWGNCPTATTVGGGESLNTRPSIFGGGQSQATPGDVPLDQQQGIPQEGQEVVPQEGLPEAQDPAGGQELPQQELPQEQPATPVPDQQELPQELPQEEPVTPIPEQ